MTCVKTGSPQRAEAVAESDAKPALRKLEPLIQLIAEVRTRIPKRLKVTAFCGLLFILCAVLYRYGVTHYARFGTDWHMAYYPATALLLHGKNPYALANLNAPPWLMVLLIPFALLGRQLGLAVMFFVGFGAFAYTAHRLGATPLSIVATLFSPVFILGFYGGNYDWLVLIGLLLPAPAGLLVAALKPQNSIGMIIYWAWQAWRQGGWRKLVTTFTPVAIAVTASFAIFGNWRAGRSDDLLHSWWNMSLFPWSIPVGLWLLYRALRKQNAGRAIAASPCLSPYVNLGTWSATLIGISDQQLPAVAISVGFWILVIAGKMLGLAI